MDSILGYINQLTVMEVFIIFSTLVYTVLAMIVIAYLSYYHFKKNSKAEKELGQDITKMPPVRFYFKILSMDGPRMEQIRLVRTLLPSTTLTEARQAVAGFPYLVGNDLTKGELNKILKIVEEYQEYVKVNYETGRTGYEKKS